MEWLPPAPLAIGAQSTEDKVQIIAADGEHICYVERDPALAIAQHIIASPLMMAALIDIIDQLEGIGIPDWHGAEGLSLEQAKQAITAAGGRVLINGR